MDSDHAMAMRMQAEENQRGNSSAGSSWSHGGSRQRRRQVNPIFPALKILMVDLLELSLIFVLLFFHKQISEVETVIPTTVTCTNLCSVKEVEKYEL